jgi:hypothetical protein
MDFAQLRAVSATHVSAPIRRSGSSWAANDVQRHDLVRVAAKAADVNAEKQGIQRVSQRRGGLRRSLYSSMRSLQEIRSASWRGVLRLLR